MNSSEKSIISYSKLPHVRYFINSIRYRNPHFHNALEILLILDGEATLFIGPKAHLLKKGNLCVINRNEVHEIVSKNNYSSVLLSLQIDPQFSQTYFPEFANTHFQSDCVSTEIVSQLSSLIIAASMSYFDKKSADAPYRCVALTTMIIGILIKALPHHELTTKEYLTQTQAMRRMERITTFINENIAEPALLQKTAKKENLTSTYLSRIFHEYFHITFQQYLFRLRIEKAMQLLCTTNRPVYDICYECGFADCRQLNKYCHQQFGKSASKCRNKNCIDTSSPFNPADCQVIEHVFNFQESIDYLLATQNLQSSILF